MASQTKLTREGTLAGDITERTGNGPGRINENRLYTRRDVARIMETDSNDWRLVTMQVKDISKQHLTGRRRTTPPLHDSTDLQHHSFEKIVLYGSDCPHEYF